MRTIWHGLIIVGLTALTQIGGLFWFVSRFFRWPLLAFLVLYALGTAATTALAPAFGRSAISCIETGHLQVRSWFYCLANRNYVTIELAEVLSQTAKTVAVRHPGTVTLVLDGNFPFFDGFPLLPHLSHHDGRKVDLAFYYRQDGQYQPGLTRSPIGYFAFEQGPTDCPDVWPTLRWNLAWLQPLWPDYSLDIERNRAVLEILSARPEVTRIFVEPHLLQRLNISHPKIRFQGCRAARHDDHIHFEIR